MNFVPMPRIFEDQPIWRAAVGAFTFVITEDGPGEYTASAKIKGALPFDGGRHDLGGLRAHKSFFAAEEACKKFYRERNA